MEFKIGDIVELKSGGPIMTVTDVGPDYGSGTVLVWCIWFVANKQEKGSFPPAALKSALPA